MFEAARQAFFAGTKGDAAVSARETFTQVKSYDGPAASPATPKSGLVASAKPDFVPA
jgi:hypothetical protein